MNFKEKRIPWNKGKSGIYSEETIIKMGVKNIGRIPWNKGIKGIHISPKTEFKKGHKPAHFIGRFKDGNGYICVYSPDHPLCAKNKTVKEHRLIMEKHLGRFLTKKEVVHHINGIKNDNRIENLQLLEHQAKHLLIDHPRQQPFNTTEQRMCTRCKEIKPLNPQNFYPTPRLKFGFGYICRPCNQIIGKEKWAKYKKEHNVPDGPYCPRWKRSQK